MLAARARAAAANGLTAAEPLSRMEAVASGALLVLLPRDSGPPPGEAAPAAGAPNGAARPPIGLVGSVLMSRDASADSFRRAVPAKGLAASAAATLGVRLSAPEGSGPSPNPDSRPTLACRGATVELASPFSPLPSLGGPFCTASWRRRRSSTQPAAAAATAATAAPTAMPAIAPADSPPLLLPLGGSCRTKRVLVGLRPSVLLSTAALKMPSGCPGAPGGAGRRGRRWHIRPVNNAPSQTHPAPSRRQLAPVFSPHLASSRWQGTGSCPGTAAPAPPAPPPARTAAARACVLATGVHQVVSVPGCGGSGFRV